ncbi:hypothetical protein [Legionella cincinnatiensis]|uniref:Uncharacterized protein n=1 Tax=Legionella cincinnatiensis TaxID=28085 RepID=A0A378IIV8_9GAMM|nr:hypothetical protein [Legionella cincinnatiensis]KTC83609.1 hypothetical protein Lcin_2296 [Legionella cincinnatiensis]STX34431.1 Uncharacterised protein [Legionella cincinnatiensis]
MPYHDSFFSNISYSWNQYKSLRNKYSQLIPIPQQSYFKPINTLDKFTSLLACPIYSPLWLGINATLFFLKSLIHLIATLLLVVPALLLAVFTFDSELSSHISSAFKQSLANTVVDATMGIIATCAAVVSLAFNPLYLITRCLTTGVSHLNEITESCCDLNIARL